MAFPYGSQEAPVSHVLEFRRNIATTVSVICFVHSELYLGFIVHFLSFGIIRTFVYDGLRR